ncbi:UNVERIFIED_ORG: PST family polysaccharide transporter [Rhizobium aethiopicum]
MAVSGVRQIAEAAGIGDAARIARSAKALRRISLVLGLLGALLLAALAFPVSNFTFGDSQHAGGIALLCLAVFLRIVSSGQNALIQGLRDIADLARINVLTGFFGTVVSIPLIYLFDAQAIAPTVVAIAAVTSLYLVVQQTDRRTRAANVGSPVWQGRDRPAEARLVLTVYPVG